MPKFLTAYSVFMSFPLVELLFYFRWEYVDRERHEEGGVSVGDLGPVGLRNWRKSVIGGSEDGEEGDDKDLGLKA